MNSIFVVTAFERTPSKRTGDRAYRTFGWYPTAEDAERTVTTNAADMFEAAFYEYCVVEEQKPGVYRHTEAARWFRADLTEDREDVIVSRCDAPEWSREACNWGMG